MPALAQVTPMSVNMGITTRESLFVDANGPFVKAPRAIMNAFPASKPPAIRMYMIPRKPTSAMAMPMCMPANRKISSSSNPIMATRTGLICTSRSLT